MEVQDVEEDEAFRVSPSSWGLEAGSGAHETRGRKGAQERVKVPSGGGGSWVLHRHTLQRFQSDVEVESCGQETSYFTVPCRG